MNAIHNRPDLSDNPIVQKIMELTDGEYIFDAQDISEIDRAEKPELVASCLSDRIEDFANDLARDDQLVAPFDPDLIPTADLIRAVDLSKPIRGYAVGASDLRKRLGTHAMLSLYEAIGTWRARVKSPIIDGGYFGSWLDLTYRVELGRRIGDEGFAFYKQAFEAGLALPTIAADIHNSDEAVAYRRGPEA